MLLFAHANGYSLWWLGRWFQQRSEYHTMNIRPIVKQNIIVSQLIFFSLVPKLIANFQSTQSPIYFYFGMGIKYIGYLRIADKNTHTTIKLVQSFQEGHFLFIDCVGNRCFVQMKSLWMRQILNFMINSRISQTWSHRWRDRYTNMKSTHFHPKTCRKRMEL